jgi:hypothetical protein
MADDHSLPGWPRKKLVKDVRRQLSHYGIRPVRSFQWQATWVWAAAIARSYYHDHWPLASEIATQYILLLLAEMKSSSMLKLPYRAKEVIPAEVVALLPGPPDNALLAIVERPSRGVRRNAVRSFDPSNHPADGLATSPPASQ